MSGRREWWRVWEIRTNQDKPGRRGWWLWQCRRPKSYFRHTPIISLELRNIINKPRRFLFSNAILNSFLHTLPKMCLNLLFLVHCLDKQLVPN